MNRIKFTSKTNLKLGNGSYKGYLIGDIPPSFGFDAKLDGIDENGQDKFKYLFSIFTLVFLSSWSLYIFINAVNIPIKNAKLIKNKYLNPLSNFLSMSILYS